MAAPYDGARDYLVGLYTGFQGEPGDLYYNCLTDQYQYSMQEHYQTILDDWKNDMAVTKTFEDVLTWLEDFIGIYDNCDIWIYPHALVESLVDDLPEVLIKFIYHLPSFIEKIYDSIELFSTDPSNAGKTLGEGLALFLHPYNPELLAAGPEPIEIFNPLNFTEGLITGLQDPSKPAPSQCLSKFQGVGGNVNAFIEQTLSCFTLHFSSCVGIGNVGRDVVSFIASIETECKIAEFADMIKSDFSYDGLYNITYRYYWNEDEINGVLEKIPEAFNDGDWFGFGKNIGTAIQDLLGFNVQ